MWCGLCVKTQLSCDFVRDHTYPGEQDTKLWDKMPLLLERGGKIDFSCVCVVKTVLLLLLSGIVGVPARVPIIGVPATSNGR